jgi:hypothetical protein
MQQRTRLEFGRLCRVVKVEGHSLLLLFRSKCKEIVDAEDGTSANEMNVLCGMVGKWHLSRCHMSHHNFGAKNENLRTTSII